MLRVPAALGHGTGVRLAYGDVMTTTPGLDDDRVVVVGAGIAGAACARSLADRGVPVSVIDRGHRPGGRLASPTVAGRPVDLGGSYLTAREPAFAAIVDGWGERGLVRPWTDTFHIARHGQVTGTTTGPMRWAATGGSRTLVADLLTGIDVVVEREVLAVSAGPAVDGRRVRAAALAMPDPQAARILDRSLPVEQAAVAGRAWDPVLAVMAGWSRREWLEDLDGLFVHDDPVLAFVADDGRRRGDGAPVLVLHSTGDHGRRWDADPEGGREELVAAATRLLGVGPPDWSKAHRWRYARPVAARTLTHHLGSSGVGLAGDGWGAARVETAWMSGTALGAALAADQAAALTRPRAG